MQTIQSYLFFNGNCRDAMEFYAGLLDGKLDMMTYGQGPQCPDGAEDSIMHAHISREGESLLMASDAPPANPVPAGHNFNLSLNCTNREQQERVFAALSEGGQVRQPLQDTFWGAHFGMVQDKFGIGWMLNHQDLPS